MIIDLPQKFFYDSGDNGKSYVQGGILYIQGQINFEDLMYTITYSVKGYERCFYCGRELDPSKRTLDHMYPRVFGGVSIPSNLVPCCKNCNGNKSCLNTSQFYHLRRIKSKDAKEKAFKGMVLQNQSLYEKRIILPRKWITNYAVNIVTDDIDFSKIRFDPIRITKLEDFYKMHLHYPKPVIVSKNDWVLEGLHILHHAKNHAIDFVPAIVLENVVHISR